MKNRTANVEKSEVMKWKSNIEEDVDTLALNRNKIVVRTWI